MTTTSLLLGSLFWGGTRSSCDDERVTASSKPGFRAGGTAVAPSWSPIEGRSSTPGPSPPLRPPLIGGLMATLAGVALLIGPASGTDYAAQRARAAFAAAHPTSAVDFRWF